MPDELFPGAYSSCPIHPYCTKGAHTVVISHPVTVKNGNQITAAEIIASSQWWRCDWSVSRQQHYCKSECSKENGCQEVWQWSRCTGVAFGTAVGQSPALNLSLSQWCSNDVHGPSHERRLSHSQLVLGWGWCVDLSCRWPLVMPSPRYAFLPKNSVQPLTLLAARLPGCCSTFQEQAHALANSRGFRLNFVPAASFQIKTRIFSMIYDVLNVKKMVAVINEIEVFSSCKLP